MGRGGLKTLLRFAVAGCVGFAVDAGLLAALVHSGGVNPYIGRAVSFPAAVTATWFINRRLAFAAHASPDKVREWGRYFAVSIVGSMVNLGVYSICIYFSDFMFRNPVAALAIASVIALLVNYQGARRHAFTA